MCVCVCVCASDCLSVCPSPNEEPKAIDWSRSKSTLGVLSQISRAVFSYSPNPKIKATSHKKKFLISIFSKMDPTILFKFCVFILYSIFETQQYDTMGFPQINPWN